MNSIYLYCCKRNKGGQNIER